MATQKFPFKVLFCFENASQLIIEIKRTDIQSEDKSLVYKWMKVQKRNENENENENEKVRVSQNEEVSVLSFRAMDSSDEQQVRLFEEGTLEWNTVDAHFNGQKMKQIEPENLAEEWKQLIEGVLF